MIQRTKIAQNKKKFQQSIYYYLSLGNASETKDVANSDLVIKINVEEDKTNKFRRVNDDIYLDLDLSLVEAIFGANKQIETIEKVTENIYISPGTQSDDKIILNNNVRISQ